MIFINKLFQKRKILHLFSLNIMKLTQSWIETQERPLCFQISSFTCSNKKEEQEKVRPS